LIVPRLLDNKPQGGRPPKIQRVATKNVGGVCYVSLMAILFDTPVPFTVKTSTPDWMEVSCECEMLMCPICDPDFFYDQMREDAGCWDEAFELEPPF